MRKPPFHSKPFRPPPWRPYLSDHRGIADMQQGLLPQCFAAETFFHCVATVETLEVLVPSSHTICVQRNIHPHPVEVMKGFSSQNAQHQTPARHALMEI